jgi:hypothetical protein
MIKEAVTGLPLGTQLELSHRDCRTQTLLVDWTYKQHRSAVYMYYPPKWPEFYNPSVPYGRDEVTCFQPRHLGTQLELANKDHSILTLLEDRTRETSRSNRMTGGRSQDMEREKQIYIKQYNSANSERKAEIEGKVEIVDNVEKTISGSTLKAMLRSIRDEANKLEAMEREKQIYIKQYNSATSERKAELEGKIEIVDNQVKSQRRMLESLREDAIEQANQDGVIIIIIS